MNLNHHVFISYSHIDNQPLPTEKEGWVSLFHDALQQLLSVRLGASADIWRDKKLTGNDIFSDEIVDQFRNTVALISILTPRYVKSEWCTREITEFCENAEQTGGISIGNKCRVFKVVKLPTDKEDPVPPILNQVLGYEFFDFDEDQAPRELDPAYGEKSKQDFLRKTAKLAWDIKLLLDQFEELASAQANPRRAVSAAKPIVYLAECGRDMREARELIEGELKRMGYSILPEKELPDDEENYKAEVAKLLAQSHLSIHLVGNSYGMIPDGLSQKSVVVLQNELAVQCSRQGTLRRLIWLPEATRSEQPAQIQFIAALHQDAAAQFGAELITGDLEILKSTLHRALQKIEEAARAGSPPSTASSKNRKTVHVLCDARDRREMVALLRFLKAHDLEASLPIFTGDAGDVREANQALLMNCDRVLLYYGAGDEAWRFHQQNELKKVRARRSEKPLPPESVYLAGPGTEDKTLLLDLQEPNVINALSGFSEEAMADFIDAVAPKTSTP